VRTIVESAGQTPHQVADKALCKPADRIMEAQPICQVLTWPATGWMGYEYLPTTPRPLLSPPLHHLFPCPPPQILPFHAISYSLSGTPVLMSSAGYTILLPSKRSELPL